LSLLGLEENTAISSVQGAAGKSRSVGGHRTPISRGFMVDIPNYTGWWYTYPSEKYEFVSWNDYSQYMEK